MSFASPAVTTCIMRPWGSIQCDCKYDIHGNATCNLGDVSSQCYTKAMQNIKSEMPKQQYKSQVASTLDELKAKAISGVKAFQSKTATTKRNQVATKQCQKSIASMPITKAPTYSTIDNIWLAVISIVFHLPSEKKKYFVSAPFHYP